MRKEELSQYRAIKKEITMLENKINNLNEKPTKGRECYGYDVVSTSSSNAPYTKHNIIISGYGYDTSSEERRKHGLIKKWKNRKKELEQKFDVKICGQEGYCNSPALSMRRKESGAYAKR